MLIVFANNVFPIFNQLEKISILIDHYDEHIVLDGDISFLHYLADHYLDNDVKGDHARDMQLPFKHIHTSNCVNVLAIVPFQIQYETQKPFDESYHYDSPLSIGDILTYQHSIFQPPKVA